MRSGPWEERALGLRYEIHFLNIVYNPFMISDLLMLGRSDIRFISITQLGKNSIILKILTYIQSS